MIDRIRELASQAEEYAEFYAAIADELEKDIFIRRLAELLLKEEREACAKLCDDVFDTVETPPERSAAEECAQAIRARWFQ